MVEGNTYISVYNFIFGRQEQQKSENTRISTIFTINKLHSQATWEWADKHKMNLSFLPFLHNGHIRFSIERLLDV